MKTFAMQIYAATYWLLAVVFLYILAVLILPMLATSPDVAAFLPIILVFLGLFVAGAAATTFLPTAHRRRWLWIGLLVPPILFLLLNAPFIPFALSHPNDIAFTAIMPLLVGALVLVWAGITAFREAGEVPAPRTGPRARWLLAAIAGGTIAAFATGFVAASAGATGQAALSAAPTTTGTELAQGTKYLTTSYTMSSSDVLGLFVQNKDGAVHSFDIDTLNIHVQVPANSTIAIAIKPTGPGTLEFYCSIPGHKAAGMVGTIEVK
jgi:plastocyanin